MAELFTDPAKWRDSTSHSPPAQWNGSNYEFFVGDTLTYLGTAKVGDTVTFDVAWKSSGSTVAAIYDASGLLASIASGGAQNTRLTATIVNPSSVTITTSDDPSTYSCDITLTPPAAPAVGDLDIDLRYSKDGSHNWADWRQQKLGDQGAFKRRAVFRRLGFGRRIVLHVRVSADKGRDLIAASVDTEAF